MDNRGKLKLEFYTLVLTDENGVRYFNLNGIISQEVYGALYLTGYKPPFKTGASFLEDSTLIADVKDNKRRLSKGKIEDRFNILDVKRDEFVIFEYLKHKIKE